MSRRYRAAGFPEELHQRRAVAIALVPSDEAAVRRRDDEGREARNLVAPLELGDVGSVAPVLALRGPRCGRGRTSALTRSATSAVVPVAVDQLARPAPGRGEIVEDGFARGRGARGRVFAGLPAHQARAVRAAPIHDGRDDPENERRQHAPRGGSAKPATAIGRASVPQSCPYANSLRAKMTVAAARKRVAARTPRPAPASAAGSPRNARSQSTVGRTWRRPRSTAFWNQRDVGLQREQHLETGHGDDVAVTGQKRREEDEHRRHLRRPQGSVAEVGQHPGRARGEGRAASERL